MNKTPCYSCSKHVEQVRRLINEKKQLEAENARLREALQRIESLDDDQLGPSCEGSIARIGATP